jgi:hypothetical protein
MAYVGYLSRTMAIDVLLSFNFDVVLSFPFPPSKAKLIGDVSMKTVGKTQRLVGCVSPF